MVVKTHGHYKKCLLLNPLMADLEKFVPPPIAILKLDNQSCKNPGPNNMCTVDCIGWADDSPCIILAIVTAILYGEADNTNGPCPTINAILTNDYQS